MWGVGVWSEVGVLIHPTGVLWDSVQDSGCAVHFWNLTVHKSFPHRPCFMAGSTVMLIKTIIITVLVFYSRQRVKMSLYPSVFRFPCIITRGPSPFHGKHPHTLMPPPPKFTVGNTHAGRYHSSGIHHTQTLPSDRHIV
jgi:hypothetical protein